MSLSNHFEPLPIPPNGLADVRRRAGKRALTFRSVAALVSAVVVMVIGGLDLAQPSFMVADSAQSSPAASADVTTSQVQAGATSAQSSTRPNYNGVHVDADSLPGGSTSSSSLRGWLLCVSGLGLLLIVAGSVLAIRSARREQVPLLRPRFVSATLITAGVLVPLVLFLVDLFAN